MDDIVSKASGHKKIRRKSASMASIASANNNGLSSKQASLLHIGGSQISIKSGTVKFETKFNNEDGDIGDIVVSREVNLSLAVSTPVYSSDPVIKDPVLQFQKQLQQLNLSEQQQRQSNGTGIANGEKVVRSPYFGSLVRRQQRMRMAIGKKASGEEVEREDEHAVVNTEEQDAGEEIPIPEEYGPKIMNAKNKNELEAIALEICAVNERNRLEMEQIKAMQAKMMADKAELEKEKQLLNSQRKQLEVEKQRVASGSGLSSNQESSQAKARSMIELSSKPEQQQPQQHQLSTNPGHSSASQTSFARLGVYILPKPSNTPSVSASASNLQARRNSAPGLDLVSQVQQQQPQQLQQIVPKPQNATLLASTSSLSTAGTSQHVSAMALNFALGPTGANSHQNLQQRQPAPVPVNRLDFGLAAAAGTPLPESRHSFGGVDTALEQLRQERIAKNANKMVSEPNMTQPLSAKNGVTAVNQQSTGSAPNVIVTMHDQNVQRPPQQQQQKSQEQAPSQHQQQHQQPQQQQQQQQQQQPANTNPPQRGRSRSELLKRSGETLVEDVKEEDSGEKVEGGVYKPRYSAPRGNGSPASVRKAAQSLAHQLASAAASVVASNKVPMNDAITERRPSIKQQEFEVMNGQIGPFKLHTAISKFENMSVVQAASQGSISNCMTPAARPSDAENAVASNANLVGNAVVYPTVGRRTSANFVDPDLL